MNLIAMQDQRGRHREQTCRYDEEGKGGTNWEIRTDTNWDYTLPRVRQIASEKLCVAQEGQLCAL